MPVNTYSKTVFAAKYSARKIELLSLLSFLRFKSRMKPFQDLKQIKSHLVGIIQLTVSSVKIGIGSYVALFILILNRQPSIIIPISGATRSTSTFQEEKLGLTITRPSYRPTGTHPSPRSVLVWRSAIRQISFLSTSRPTLCTHWSLTGNTAPPHWVVTRGRRWLVHRLPCRPTATKKGSTLLAAIMVLLEQELVSLATTKMSVAVVTHELGLVRREHLAWMTLIRVEMRLSITRQQTMAENISKPWDIF